MKNTTEETPYIWQTIWCMTNQKLKPVRSKSFIDNQHYNCATLYYEE